MTDHSQHWISANMQRCERKQIETPMSTVSVPISEKREPYVWCMASSCVRLCFHLSTSISPYQGQHTTNYQAHGANHYIPRSPHYVYSNRLFILRSFVHVRSLLGPHKGRLACKAGILPLVRSFRPLLFGQGLVIYSFYNKDKLLANTVFLPDALQYGWITYHTV